ncbi:hypothetical protein B1H10_01595, partial [candidate division KSB1 bacterium 4484_188]
VFNILGQKIKTLGDGRIPAGEHRVTWEGRDNTGREVASGVYIYRLSAGQGFVESRKMLLLR